MFKFKQSLNESTNDLNGFINAIIKNPNESINYFAFADYLVENNHPAKDAIRDIGNAIQSGKNRIVFLANLFTHNRQKSLQQLVQLFKQVPKLAETIVRAKKEDVRVLLDGHTSNVGTYHVDSVSFDNIYFIVRGSIEANLSHLGPNVYRTWSFRLTLNDMLEVEDIEIEITPGLVEPERNTERGYSISFRVDPEDTRRKIIEDLGKIFHSYEQIFRMMIGVN